MNPHNGRLITVPIGVHCWPTECLRPVRGKALSVLRMVSMAERMANNFVLQHPRVPRTRQSQDPVDSTCGFIDGLHDFSVLSQMMEHFIKRERDVMERFRFISKFLPLTKSSSSRVVSRGNRTRSPRGIRAGDASSS